jgi:hypothetical protein
VKLDKAGCPRDLAPTSGTYPREIRLRAGALSCYAATKGGRDELAEYDEKHNHDDNEHHESSKHQCRLVIRCDRPEIHAARAVPRHKEHVAQDREHHGDDQERPEGMRLEESHCPHFSIGRLRKQSRPASPPLGVSVRVDVVDPPRCSSETDARAGD